MLAARLACRPTAVLAVVLAVCLPAVAGADGDLFQPVNLRGVGTPDTRFYLAGILGSTWGTFEVDGAPSATGPLFTAGGAAGLAFERENGRLRLEFEGRGRDAIGGRFADADTSTSLRASDGWSTLVNLWRDVDLTDRLGIYAGGGIGGGGYNSLGLSSAVPAENFTIDGSGNASGFAWQAGGGLIYAVTERITLDLGYRFFAIDSGSLTATSRQDAVPIETLSLGTGFSASELLFTIRIYEPFRGWL